MKREELIKTIKKYSELMRVTKAGEARMGISEKAYDSLTDEILSLSPSPQPSTVEKTMTAKEFVIQKYGVNWLECEWQSDDVLDAMEEYAAHPVAEREVPMRADVKTYLEAKSKNAGWLNFNHFLHGMGGSTEETIIAWVEQYCAGVMAEREVPEAKDKCFINSEWCDTHCGTDTCKHHPNYNG